MSEDLISREALKEAIRNPNDKRYLSESIISLVFERIDNAPTVEPDILYLCDHKKCGDNFNCYECNHTSDIRHAINFDLMEFPRSFFVERKRTQGEWMKQGIYFECPICHCGCMHTIVDKIVYGKLNFCPNCGARMVKGGEEE